MGIVELLRELHWGDIDMELLCCDWKLNPEKISLLKIIRKNYTKVSEILRPGTSSSVAAAAGVVVPAFACCGLDCQRGLVDW